MPAPGRYELSDTTADGFRAMYIAGSSERPTGLYRAKRGTLEITASSAEHISGHFSFTAAGFLASDPTDDGLGGEGRRRLHVHPRSGRAAGPTLSEEEPAEREPRRYGARWAESLPGARVFGRCFRRDEIEVRSR